MLDEESSPKLDMSTDALINFNSIEDESSSGGNYTFKSPLIPCPSSVISPESDNNPFDTVIKAARTEFRFQTSHCLRSYCESNATYCTDSLIEICTEDEKNVVESDNEKGAHLQNGSNKFGTTDGERELNTEGQFNNNSEDADGSANGSSESLEMLKNDDGIRVAIARRVSSCIQKALNNSYSHPDLRNTNSLKNKRNSCSLSELNRSTYTPPKNKRIVNQSFNHNKSLDSPNRTRNGLEQMRNETMFTDPSLQQHIFTEARKLAEIIKNSEYRHVIEVPDAHINLECFDDVDDLMDENPVWDSSIPSDDELDENGLPVLKLSLAHRSDRKMSFRSSDSEALTRFRNRNRASLDLSTIEPRDEKVQAADKGQSRRSDEGVPNKLETSLDEISNKPPSQLVVLPDPSNIKLRAKKSSDLPKKGPLKAIVPLQKMTRKIADKISSPLKGQKKSPTQSKEKIATSKDNSYFSHTPVAASTPNKNQGSIDSTGDKPSLARSTPRSRYSRRDVSSTPSKRSSSANSNNSSERIAFNSSSVTPIYSDEKLTTGKHEKKETPKGAREGRPKTAPTIGDKPRVLADLPKPFTSPQNTIRKSPFGKLISKFKRSGSLPARDKENRITTT